MLTQSSTPTTDLKSIALRSMLIMRDGTLEDFEEIVHPEAVNREATEEPPESRGPGPRPFYATALWLRAAFADLDFEIHEVIAEGDLVVIHNTMTGRHTGTFVAYDEQAEVADVFPPTGRAFASTQTHWLRIADGRVIEHWANRDDMATAAQAGWIPPTPWYLLRMALAKRRAKREHAAART